MRVYAIRHKPTGEFMPNRVCRGAARGWSWWVPGDKPPPDDPNPRIFFTLQSVRNALTSWLQGPWERVTGTESDGWEHPSYTVDLGPAPVKAEVPERKREDMEIVPFELTDASPLSDDCPVTQADVDEARRIVLDAMATDLLSGNRRVVKSDRYTVYGWLSKALTLLSGTVRP